MDYELIYILLILFSFKIYSNSSEIGNTFSIILVEENMNGGTYVRMTKSENGYLYIVAGEDSENNDINRYILKFDINSLTLEETIKYRSRFTFIRGEPFAIGDNSQYLFISFFHDPSGEYEIFNLEDKSSIKEVDSFDINAYRRVFIKSGSDYYFVNIIGGDGHHLFIRRLRITSYSNNLPNLETVNENREVSIQYSAMISCDFSKYKDIIICAYFAHCGTELCVSISIYNDQLDLISTRPFEAIGYFDGSDNFIKIVYLKGNSDFVLMNSQLQEITRLRYFNYGYNYFDEKLNSIVGSTFLDIENSQKEGHNGSNDIIAFNSNKVIKIYTHFPSNFIIITIIQFYEDEDGNSMSIKIYNMENNNEFCYLTQPRIEIMKNSFVIALSATRDGRHRPGYFIINFPSSKDANMEGDKLKINELISVENKLFEIKAKLKILNIPQDFVFVNKLNSVVNENDELKENDELILREYPVNVGEKILEYQAIAQGYDFGYSSIKIYGPKTILDNEEFLFEGRKGKIKLNFDDCLDGYHYLYPDMHLCSNVKPINSYIDADINAYKPCNPSCKECNKPINNSYMNCIDCPQNYYITEDTRSCYDSVIDNYYLDINDNFTLRRCHPSCLKCYSSPINSTFMNCITCQNNYYMTEDTYNR